MFCLQNKISVVSDNNQQLYQSQQQECDNPDCLCNIRHEADEKRDSDGEDPNTGTLLKY